MVLELASLPLNHACMSYPQSTTFSMICATFERRRRGLSITQVIDNAINEYNKYRVPEVKAELISFQDESLVLEFDGSFCTTCGYYDYFEDFRFLLEHEFGLDAKITEIEETPEGAIVEFSVSKGDNLT